MLQNDANILDRRKEEDHSKSDRGSYSNNDVYTSSHSSRVSDTLRIDLDGLKVQQSRETG